MKFLQYLRWSNIKFSIDLNPFTWSFKWVYDNDCIDYILMVYVRLGFLSILLMIDDGVYKVRGE